MSYKSVHTLQQKRWNIAQFFERRWWRRYLQKKSVKEYLDWKRTYWTDFLRNMQIEPKDGQVVLDAGTGPAGIQIILDQQKVYAIDPLIDAYNEMHHFSKKDYPWTTFRSQGLETIEEEAQYDHVFCLNVINHVIDFDAAMDALCKSIKHDGAITLSIDCHRYRFAQWLLKSIPLDILHPHQYRLDEYVSALEQRGIVVTKQRLIKSGTLFDYWAINGTKA